MRPVALRGRRAAEPAPGARIDAPASVPAAAGRYWEIDAARTLAIAMMVAYHIVYDIDLAAPGLGPDPFRGSWGLLPEATGSLFLAVAGMSLSISDARLRARGVGAWERWRSHARRAAIVLAAGMLVTAATWVVFPDRFVRFGILHAIGVSILVGAALVRFPALTAIAGGAAIAAGLAVAGGTSDAPGGLVVGLPPAGFSSVDYWPLLPWMGALLLGAALGSLLYPGGRRAGPLTRIPPGPRATRPLTAPGRHSLPVYLVHQLILVPVVWAVVRVGQAVGAW